MRIAIAVVMLSAAAAQADSAPRVSGLGADHPLEQAHVGALLISELRCASCHGEHTDLGFAPPPAPVLDDVGARVSPGFLKRYIANPGRTDPGTAMPNLLDHLPADERASTAADLADYLHSLSDERFRRQPVNAKDAAAGRDLYHSVGCVACHAPRGKDGKPIDVAGSIPLTHVPDKYSLPSLTGFLFQPHATRPGGRMPDMHLSRDEAARIASYLIGTADRDAPAHQPDPARVKRGEAAFARYQCASCHSTGEPPKPAGAAAPRWKDADPAKGCLDPSSKTTPRYRLDDPQAAAIRAAMKAGPVKLDDKAQLAVALTAFNCVACHERDDYGGPADEINEFFATEEPELGDHARIPPTLTLAGAKLKTVWLQKVLFDGESVRPFMHTRMPQFGEANIGHLPAMLKRVDRLEPVEMPAPDRNGRRALRDAGHLMLGDKGLNCIACHNFNTLESPGFKGIDLMTSFDRLEPAWFVAFMKNPQKMRPGIVMPSFWPDGKAVRHDILEGKTDEQLRALWYTFSLGRSAGTPSGMRRTGSKLLVTDEPRVYRGRSRIAGFRGIAVGFPGGLNYAFNAETGALSGLWRGEFVNVSWGGQGAGDFNPAERAVALAKDLALYRLKDENEPWPLLPKMTKEQPVNPDPLYPKNRGYRFRGYELDDGGVPTIFYETGGVTVHDRSVAKKRGDALYLERTFTFESDKTDAVWFRVLTGKIEKAGDRSYEAGGVQVNLPDAPVRMRESELLVKLNIPKGKSTVTVEYELVQ